MSSSRLVGMELSWLTEVPREQWKLLKEERRTPDKLLDEIPLEELRAEQHIFTNVKPQLVKKGKRRIMPVNKVAPARNSMDVASVDSLNVPKFRKILSKGLLKAGSLSESARSRTSYSATKTIDFHPNKHSRTRPRSASVSNSTGTIGNLYMVQHERRRLDLDCQLLENRIKLLRKEEDKISKRISSTKQQTQAIKAQGKSTPSNKIKKEELIKVKTKENKHVIGTEASEVEQRRRALERGIRHMNKDVQQQCIIAEKASKAKELKSAKLKIRAHIAQMREKHKAEKFTKSEKIRKQREVAKANVAKKEKRRRAAVAKEMAEKLRLQQQEKNVQEEKLHRLEILEEECIHRLERMSTKQHIVRVNLEKTT